MKPKHIIVFFSKFDENRQSGSEFIKTKINCPKFPHDYSYLWKVSVLVDILAWPIKVRGQNIITFHSLVMVNLYNYN